MNGSYEDCRSVWGWSGGGERSGWVRLLTPLLSFSQDLIPDFPYEGDAFEEELLR